MRAETCAAIVLNLAPVRAGHRYPVSSLVKGGRLTDGYRDRVWLEPLLRGTYPSDMIQFVRAVWWSPRPGRRHALHSTPLDWLGINHYHDIILEREEGEDRASDRVEVHPGVVGVREAPPSCEHTDLGWPITPDGLRTLLVSVARTYPNVPPMMMTENGAALHDPVEVDGTIADEQRIRYLGAHVDALTGAIGQGVDVRGYLVWSLLDNFEWAEGYGQRFGLVEVDDVTQARTPRRSATWYREIIRRQVGSHVRSRAGARGVPVE